MTRSKSLRSRSTIGALLALFFFCTPLAAQPLHQGEWVTYTAMDSITDLGVMPTSGYVWAATWGGAFRFAPQDPLTGIIALRNSDGLSDNNLTAVAADPSGKIYFGGVNGTIDIYNESTGKLTAIRDISLATQYPRRKIYQISLSGSKVYFATGFGLSIYDTILKVFTETIPHFGSLIEQDTVFGSSELTDSLYVVLSGAIAIAPKNAPSLSDPFAWRTIKAPKLTTLNSMVAFGSNIVLGGPSGLYVLSGDSMRYIAMADSIKVAKLFVSKNTLYILDSRNNKLLTTSDLVNFTASGLAGDITTDNISTFSFATAGEKIFGYGIGGAVVEAASGKVTTKIYPEGPLANDIFDLYYCPSLGKLFATLGPVGISSFETEKSAWTGLGTRDGVLPQARYLSAFYDTIRAKLWTGTFGSGLFSLGSALPANIQHYDSSNGITSLSGRGNGYTVIGRGSLDNHGNFMTTSWASNGEGLLTTSDGNNFKRIQLNPPDDPYRPYDIPVQDLDDIYYVGMYNYNIENPVPIGVSVVAADGSTQTIRGGQGQVLGSATINALLVDQDNGLWCGTDVGVDVLTHSYVSGKPQFRAHPRRLVFTDQQVIRAIAVDGVGNKWVGTDNGVFVLSADGSDSLAHFTTSNSPLIDNSVVSIAIDLKNGEAYLGTHKGISRVSSIFKQGGSNYSGMYVYPNPIIQRSDDQLKVTITGLAGGSTVKIYTINRRLVATIDGSQLGSTLTWNGRDENGKLLSSGVYIAAAASPVTSDYGETKFVLIRK
ncbi:MAG: hypothetical protein ABI778_06780 [Ignavibacteriota bacterium]